MSIGSAISQAAPFISTRPEAHGGADGFGVLGFSWAYALVRDSRRMVGPIGSVRARCLMRVVIMWSAFTALTGYAWNAFSLIITRFFFARARRAVFRISQGFHDLAAER